MNLINWKEFLIPYEYAVEELKVKFKNVRKELRSANSYSPIEFVTGRVKKVSSIIDKAGRLGIELTEEALRENMEDIAGIRIMCQFVEDIYIMAEHIKKRGDMQVLYEKDYVKNYKESGYRSYHIIFSYPIQTATDLKKILAEVQLRTLSMNFWATIEHSLKYKYEEVLPVNLSERLKTSADAAFKLDQEMGCIKDEIVNAQLSFEERSSLMEDTLMFINVLAELAGRKEASEYIIRFSKLTGKNDITALKLLYKEIRERINEYNLKKITKKTD